MTAQKIDVMKWWPLVIAATMVIATASVGNFRLSAQEEEVSDLSKSIDENEEEIEATNRRLEQLAAEIKIQQLQTQNSIEKLATGQTRSLNLILQKLEADQ